MKKIIAAFDGLRFSESTMSYAIFLASKTKAHLVGIFLEDFMRRSYGYQEMTHYAGDDLDAYVHKLDEKDDEEREKSIETFRHACANSHLTYSIHRDRNVALQELLQESIYADLLVISATDTLTKYEEQAPTRFVKDLLNEVQCPVVLAPAAYHGIDKIILLYDGEPSSVHAVRMFSYLLDPLKYLPTQILTVNKPGESVVLPNGRLIREFIHDHFPKAEAIVLKGEAETEISAYLSRVKGQPLVVLGAYQRSRFSRVFKPSMADHLLHQTTVPLFIAHNKS